MKKLLIDASLTGGRGPAKQAYEFVTACQERGVPYTLLTNRSFVPKLQDLGLKPDIVLEVELSQDRLAIYQAFEKALADIDFDLLVKFGARTASAYTAAKYGKPFVVVDGGLPDKLEDYPSLYAREGYTKAKKYILTTNFPWKYPLNPEMDNIVIGTYPFSQKTLGLTCGLRTFKREAVVSRVKDVVPEVAERSYDLLVNLVITGSYIANPFDRVAYGAWMTAQQYDQVVGFVRRFITDLGIQYKGKALVYMDKELYNVVGDLLEQYPNVTACFNRKDWSYETEIYMFRLADVLVSRATNYVPSIAMMGQGGLVTTPVPANGYMDEDTAGYQALALGLTELIPYDDEQYMEKFLWFAKDKERQKSISKNLIRVSDEMVQQANAVDLILDELA